MILSLVFLPLLLIAFLPALLSSWYDDRLEALLGWLGTGGALATWALAVAIALNAGQRSESVERRGR